MLEFRAEANINSAREIANASVHTVVPPAESPCFFGSIRPRVSLKQPGSDVLNSKFISRRNINLFRRRYRRRVSKSLHDSARRLSLLCSILRREF